MECAYGVELHLFLAARLSVPKLLVITGDLDNMNFLKLFFLNAIIPHHVL